MKSKSFGYKVGSLFLSLSLAFQPIAQALPAGVATIATTSDVARTLLLQDLSSLGTVEKMEQGSGAFVFLIQDAHGEPQLQNSMVAMITHLIEKYEVEVVGLEGASGRIAAEQLRVFGQKDSDEAIADYMLQSGEISGPEYLAMVEKHPVSWVGIEAKELYQKNRQAYDSLDVSFQLSLPYRQALHRRFQRLKQKIYNPALLQWDTWVQDFRNEKVSLRHFLKRLPDVPHLNLNESSSEMKYPSLTRLLYLQKASLVSQNPEAINQEKKSLENELEKKGSSEQMREALLEILARFTAMETAFNARRAAEKLFDLGRKEGLVWSHYPLLTKQIAQSVLASEIDASSMAREIELLIKEIYDHYLVQADERYLQIFAEDLRLAEIRMQAQMSADQEAEWTFNQSRMMSGEMLETLRQFETQYLSQARGGPMPADAHWIQSFNEAGRFYQYAKQREESMVQNLRAEMKQKGSQRAILVAGGFHADGLQDALTKEGIGFASLRPKMSAEPKKSLYQALLQEKATTLEKQLGFDKKQSWEKKNNYTEAQYLSPALKSAVDYLGTSQAYPVAVLLEAVLHNLGPVLKTIPDVGQEPIAIPVAKNSLLAGTVISISPAQSGALQVQVAPNQILREQRGYTNFSTQLSLQGNFLSANQTQHLMASSLGDQDGGVDASEKEQIDRLLAQMREETSWPQWHRLLRKVTDLSDEEAQLITIRLDGGQAVTMPLPPFIANEPALLQRFESFLSATAYALTIIFGTSKIQIGSYQEVHIKDEDLRKRVSEILTANYQDVSQTGKGLKDYGNLGRSIMIESLDVVDEPGKAREDQDEEGGAEVVPGLYLGIDIGGTSMKFEVREVDEDGRNHMLEFPEDLRKLLTAPEYGTEGHESGEVFVARVVHHVKLIQEYLTAQGLPNVLAVVTVIPGAVDTITNQNVSFGEVKRRKQWTHEDETQAQSLVKRIGEGVNTRDAYLRNDMVGYAGGVLSLHPEINSGYFIVLGSGMGAQLIVDGKILESAPTEMGHLPGSFLPVDGEILATEWFTGAEGLRREAASRGLLQGNEGLVAGKIVALAQLAFDENQDSVKQRLALEVFRSAAEHVARNIRLSLDLAKEVDLPIEEKVYITGGVARGKSGQFLLATIKAALEEYEALGDGRELPEIILLDEGQLEQEAQGAIAAVGASQIAVELYIQSKRDESTTGGNTLSFPGQSDTPLADANQQRESAESLGPPIIKKNAKGLQSLETGLKSLYRDLIAINLELIELSTPVPSVNGRKEKTKKGAEQGVKNKYLALAERLATANTEYLTPLIAGTRIHFKDFTPKGKATVDGIHTLLKQATSFIIGKDATPTEGRVDGAMKKLSQDSPQPIVANTKLVAAITRIDKALEQLRTYKIRQVQGSDFKAGRFYRSKEGKYRIARGIYRNSSYRKQQAVATQRYAYQEFDSAWEAFRFVDHQLESEWLEQARMQETLTVLDQMIKNLLTLKDEKPVTLPAGMSETLFPSPLTEREQALQESLTLFQKLVRPQWALNKVIAKKGSEQLEALIKRKAWGPARSVAGLIKMMIELRLQEVQQIGDALERRRVEEMRQWIGERNVLLAQQIMRIETSKESLASLPAGNQNPMDELLRLLNVHSNEPELDGLTPLLLTLKALVSSGKAFGVEPILDLLQTKINHSGLLAPFMIQYRERLRLRLLSAKDGEKLDEIKKIIFLEAYRDFSAQHLTEQGISESSSEERRFFLAAVQAVFIPVKINDPNAKKARISNPLFDAWKRLMRLLWLNDFSLIGQVSPTKQQKEPALFALLRNLASTVSEKKMTGLTREQKIQVIQALESDYGLKNGEMLTWISLRSDLNAPVAGITQPDISTLEPPVDGKQKVRIDRSAQSLGTSFVEDVKTLLPYFRANGRNLAVVLGTARQLTADFVPVDQPTQVRRALQTLLQGGRATQHAISMIQPEIDLNGFKTRALQELFAIPEEGAFTYLVLSLSREPSASLMASISDYLQLNPQAMVFFVLEPDASEEWVQAFDKNWGTEIKNRIQSEVISDQKSRQALIRELLNGDVQYKRAREIAPSLRTHLDYQDSVVFLWPETGAFISQAGLASQINTSDRPAEWTPGQVDRISPLLAFTLGRWDGDLTALALRERMPEFSQLLTPQAGGSGRFSLNWTAVLMQTLTSELQAMLARETAA